MQTTKDKIKQLEGLLKDFLEQYNDLVQPYGLGYEMPEEKSLKATEIMNHAENVRKQLQELKTSIGIAVADPKPKKSNAQRIDMKGKSCDWAIYMLAKQLGCSRLFIKAQLYSHSLMFLQRVEPYSAQSVRIADDKRYQDWFKKRYKTGLLFCLQSIQQNAAPEDKVKRLSWAVQIWVGYAMSPFNTIAYHRFKDEYFGDGINEAV